MMPKILTQDEIDLLLASAADRPPHGDEPSRPVVAYDFTRPDRVAKDQIRALQLLHERFARNATSSLSAYLRTTTELVIMSVEQVSYAEFQMALPDPTAFYAVVMQPFDMLVALDLTPPVAFTMVDRMLGGTGRGGPMDRALTEIEQNVVDSVVRLLLDHLTETWRTVADVQFHIQARETRPQMLPVAGRNEIVILLVFDLKVGEVRGMLHVCIPATVIEAAGPAFGQGWQKTQRAPTDLERQWLADSLCRVPVAVTGRLDTRLKARDLLNLAPGHVLDLGISLHTPVEVRAGDTSKFTGRLTKVDGRVAVIVDRQTTANQSETEARA